MKLLSALFLIFAIFLTIFTQVPMIAAGDTPKGKPPREGCIWSTTGNDIGGTCVGGTAYDMDYNSINRIETCVDDINKDWCVVVFKENLQQTDFHCFNIYNTIPALGGKVCGNAPWDINSGGCARLRAPDGSACIVCCCRGHLCNNQFTFAKELQQQYVFPNPSPKLSISKITTFSIIYHMFHIFLHTQ
ncbi:hypothetical protein FO519_005879 [Halicephalobus sp. NKZ332]|nr:hypothetical protein FO519_005879 [Halicephalobus sp. NKZ332]